MHHKGFLSFILLLLCDVNRANLYTRATEIIYFLVFRLVFNHTLLLFCVSLYPERLVNETKNLSKGEEIDFF